MAEKLIVLTDVDGVMNEGKLMSEITATEARDMIESGVISGGMIPKISCCLNNNVANVHILNGTIEHAILLEIFTDHGVGTKIIKTENTFEESVGE
jgi:acetylglutamate kinase